MPLLLVTRATTSVNRRFTGPTFRAFADFPNLRTREVVFAVERFGISYQTGSGAISIVSQARADLLPRGIRASGLKQQGDLIEMLLASNYNIEL